MSGSDTLQQGWWVVAFIDLLGQKDAFMRADFVPDRDDPEAAERLLAALKDSIGVIRTLHALLQLFQEGSASSDIDPGSPLRDLAPEQRIVAQKLKARQVRELRWSDGVVRYAPLQPSDSHNPMMGLTDILITSAALAMVQLAAGKPIRGGIDVGAGIEADGQLYGASLVKAYTLESRIAQSPRIVVGAALLQYLEASTRGAGDDIDGRWHRGLAQRARRAVVKDEDDQWILDFAGPAVREMFPSMPSLGLYQQAVEFVRASREEFRAAGNAKLFERYSKVARYLDSRSDLWEAG